MVKNALIAFALAVVAAGGLSVSHTLMQQVAGSQLAAVESSSDGILSSPDKVIGFLSGLKQDADGYFIYGWTCQKNVSQSIKFHVYANGAHIGTGLADRQNEAAISTACKTSGSSHRFKHYLPNTLLEEHEGEAIRVYGIHVSGDVPNSALVHSGEFTFPALEPVPTSEPTCTLTAQPSTIDKGESSKLSWTSTNATSLSINNGIGSVSPVGSGSKNVTPSVTTTYTATATGAGGSATCNAKVTVQDVPPPPPPPDISDTFSVGDRVAVSGTGSVLNIRSTPNGIKIGTQADGSIGTVAIPPSSQNGIKIPPSSQNGIKAGGYYWWYVNFDSGVDGWAVEKYLVDYVSLPPTPPKGVVGKIEPTGVIKGWAFDPNTPSDSIRVLFYSDGPLGNGRYMGDIIADTYRGDVNNAYNISGNHGFEYTIPNGYRDGTSHKLYIYAIDTSTGKEQLLPNASGAESYKLPKPSANCASNAQAAGPTYIDLNFENGTLKHYLNPPVYHNLYDYLEDGKTHRFEFDVIPPKAPVPTRYSLWLDREHAAGGCQSLAVQVDSETTVGSSKAQMTVTDWGDSFSPNVFTGTRRYLAYDIMFDDDYEVRPLGNSNFLLHMQARQRTGGCGPAFDIRTLPQADKDGPIVMSFQIRNDNLLCVTDPDKVEVYHQTMERGRWYRIVIQMEPSALGDGRTGKLAAWIDGHLVFNHNGDWGYKTTNAQDGTLSISLGTYRHGQTEKQVVYFDNVRVGNTYASVNDE